MSIEQVSGDDTAARQHWMGVLARACPRELAERVRGLGALPGFTWLRPPEPGQVMVRGRAGGDGAPFSLGEMTVTRCALQVEGGHVGHAYVQGRDRDHARDAALMDALLQEPDRQSSLIEAVIEPLAREHAARRDARSREAARTRVDFFTLVRGDNPR